MTEADPRPQLRAALDQTERQVQAIRPADLDRPTASGFDVRTLLAHLIAVVRRVDAAGRGEKFTSVADPATDVTDDHAAAFRSARVALDESWADVEKLDRIWTLPWGGMAGRDFLDAYAHEFTGHAWDLAPLTGGVATLDPALAVAALDWYHHFVPAEGRPADGPFAPVVEIPDDAGAYRRLAAWIGREDAR